MNIENHPCFNDKKRHLYGRVHLPIAPKCNIRCNYCDRKFDCMNESRPGVTSKVLTPAQSRVYLDKIIKKNPNITVVGIAGPGDPFANPEETMETLRLVRRQFSEMILCLATNGLNILPYIEDLGKLKISHVTLTINAVDPAVGAEIYAWIRDGNKIYRGIEGAKLILDRQMKAIKKLKEQNILVKINTIVIPGINDDKVIDVVQKVKNLGADIINCIPIHSNKNTVFANIDEPSEETIARIRIEAGKFIPQMQHCTRCRADAVGLIEEQMSEEDFNLLKECADLPINPTAERPFVAVTSMEGVLINQHLGEATKVWIYKNKNGIPEFMETRSTPVSGQGIKRWLVFSEILKDCSVLIVNGSGDNPINMFNENGINVIITEGIIDENLERLFKGETLTAYKKREGCSKGVDCSGNGQGCG